MTFPLVKTKSAGDEPWAAAGGCRAIDAPTTLATSDARRIGFTAYSLSLPRRRCAHRVEEHLATHHRQHGFDLVDLIGRDRQVVAIDDHEVGQAALLD